MIGRATADRRVLGRAVRPPRDDAGRLRTGDQCRRNRRGADQEPGERRDVAAGAFGLVEQRRQVERRARARGDAVRLDGRSGTPRTPPVEHDRQTAAGERSQQAEYRGDVPGGERRERPRLSIGTGERRSRRATSRASAGPPSAPRWTPTCRAHTPPMRDPASRRPRCRPMAGGRRVRSSRLTLARRRSTAPHPAPAAEARALVPGTNARACTDDHDAGTGLGDGEVDLLGAGGDDEWNHDGTEEPERDDEFEPRGVRRRLHHHGVTWADAEPIGVDRAVASARPRISDNVRSTTPPSVCSKTILSSGRSRAPAAIASPIVTSPYQPSARHC